MSNIFLHLHTWATGAPYFQALLWNNRNFLESGDFIYSNAELEHSIFASNHQKLITQLLYWRRNRTEFDANTQQALDQWRSCLDAGKNIIISYRPRTIAQDFISLHSFFKSAFADHSVKYFCSFGRMDYAYEELALVYPFLANASLLTSLKDYAAYPNIIKQIQQIAGKENYFITLPQLQPGINNTIRLNSQTKEFCSFANLPPELLRITPVMPGLAASMHMQIIASINNDWQRPQTKKIMLELENLNSNCKTISGSEKEQLDQLANRQKKTWSDAVELADAGHVWEEPKRNQTDESEQSCKNPAAIARETTEFIKNNINIVPAKWKPFANALLQENNITISQPPAMSVLTMAYNQEKYIAECIESVAAQQCSFSMEHIIVDDCSSDATRNIIAELAGKYPHIRPIFLDYRGGNANIYALFNACRSKYAALCDGDDYFIDPLKLQKQFDFLETHPDCSICFHPVEKRYEDGSPTELYPPVSMLPGNGKRHIFSIIDLFKGNMIQTNSVMYRWRFRSGLPDWFDASLIPSDWYWHLLHAETGMIGYLREPMAVYRRHGNSLFALSEQSHTKHRATFGKAELKLYDSLNRHFQGRYEKDLQTLANGVFADYLQIYSETEDDELLNSAVEEYPQFAKHFLEKLKSLQEGN